MNFLTVLSGCRIASFVYVGTSHQKHTNPIYEDCTLMMNVNTPNNPDLNQQPISISKRIKTKQNLVQLQSNDTIYVTFTKLQSFVNDILPHISVNVVLITGQWQLQEGKTPLST